MAVGGCQKKGEGVGKMKNKHENQQLVNVFVRANTEFIGSAKSGQSIFLGSEQLWVFNSMSYMPLLLIEFTSFKKSIPL